MAWSELCQAPRSSHIQSPSSSQGLGGSNESREVLGTCAALQPPRTALHRPCPGPGPASCKEIPILYKYYSGVTRSCGIFRAMFTIRPPPPHFLCPVCPTRTSMPSPSRHSRTDVATTGYTGRSRRTSRGRAGQALCGQVGEPGGKAQEGSSKGFEEAACTIDAILAHTPKPSPPRTTTCSPQPCNAELRAALPAHRDAASSMRTVPDCMAAAGRAADMVCTSGWRSGTGHQQGTSLSQIRGARSIALVEVAGDNSPQTGQDAARRRCMSRGREVSDSWTRGNGDPAMLSSQAHLWMQPLPASTYCYLSSSCLSAPRHGP